MKLTIDNLDGLGLRDYSAQVSEGAAIRRRLNRPAELRLSLVLGSPADMAQEASAPQQGARIRLTTDDGTQLFTGYLVGPATGVYVGIGERGERYQYELRALSDVMVLDQKRVAAYPPFVARTAGEAFQKMTENALPGWFDFSGVEAADTIPYFSVDPSKPWTEMAAEIAVLGRCSYRDSDEKLYVAPLAARTYALSESDAAFSPRDLQLQPTSRLVNDVTVLGQTEPAAHVKDYFVGDGFTTTFYLSQIPFTRRSEVPQYSRTILDEEYSAPDPTHWAMTDPRGVISVSGGDLQISGGTGSDGQTRVDFVEKVELGGATVLEHGDVVFSGASDGVIGGLYAGAISIAGCLAGFRITPAGANSNLQALVNGALVGPVLGTQVGHRYVFRTRLYPTETYRIGQVFHSSEHGEGNALGGGAIASAVRIVLEVHDVNPADPASQVAGATVLYDGVIQDAPGFCTYSLVNAANMHCAFAFTEVFLATDALVRSELPQENARTRRTGSLREGAECRISSTPALQFYPQYIPAANETIEVTYRSGRQAMGRVVDAESIASHRNGLDDGVRGKIVHVAAPSPRTSADCEIAALALLEDSGQGWSGEYKVWSRFLPGGAEDIFPGDGLAVNLPSREASFLGIVREVDVTTLDLGTEDLRYALRFVDAGDPGLGFAFGTAQVKQTKAVPPVPMEQVGSMPVNDLVGAEITSIGSTTVTVDAGMAPGAGGGIEIRYSDTGWGTDNSRNLLGRYVTRTFELPRYARVQTYYLRSYDSSQPPNYSRNSTALHVDYPL